jgi:tyrosine-protein phosphatase SIW14
MNMRLFLLLLLGVIHAADIAQAADAPSTPRVRPLAWAQPIIGTKLENLHQVSPEVYRSGQPSARDLKQLVEQLGIKSVLCLRDFHNDDNEADGLSLALYRVEMEADDVEPEKVARAMRIIKDAPKPILIHCWHGSDRTGLVVAAYRMTFQNWSANDAVDELTNGGFGYHQKLFPGIADWLRAGAIQAGVGANEKK